MIQLCLKVVFLDPRMELDLLDLHLVLLLATLPLLLAFLVLVLAVVHDPANHRIGIGSDLYQVQPGLLGTPDRLVKADDTGVFLGFRYNSYLAASKAPVIGAN